MKISTTKKAAILATVLSGFVLGSSAEAAKLGIVTASDYSTSHMGALEGSYINSDDIKAVQSVITGLNRDPAVYNTIDQVTGESSLYIRQYNYSTTNLQNSYAFNAQGSWDEANRAVGNTSGAVNAHDVARHNNYVYVASYDEGTIGIAKVEGNNILDIPSMTVDLKQHLKDYEGITFDNANASLHGEGVVILDGALYVIANVNPKGGYTPYDPSYLMKYVIQEDGSLSYDGCTTMGKNTDSVSLNVYNNYMLATAIGGYQYYGAENSNAETSINVATIHPEYNYLQSSRAINLPENLLQVRDGKTIPKSEFRSLKVMPNGTAYVMTYNIGRAGKNVDVTVYQTTISNLLSEKPQNWKEVYKQEAAPGWFGRLDAEQNTNRLWVQVGNKLNIYTDGAEDPLSFGTDDFAGNQMYEELYTWDIIGTDIIPESNLVKLQLAVNEAKAPNANAVTWKEIKTDYNIGQLENVTQKTIDKMLDGNKKPVDNLISLGQDVEGNLTNNVLAGIYADGVTSKVNANEGLQIQVHNTIASPVGIYAGNGGSVKFTGTSGNLDILTQTLEGGNTVTNAIWLDPSKDGGEEIQIIAKATNITIEGGYGGNGIALQKTDRWGENSKESAKGGTITINGDVNIKGADNETWGIGANPTNVLSRFNNAGILVDVNNSSVEVNGNVDMDIYGNGVTVTGDNGTVTLKKGGTITVPTGTNYGYYALAAYDGTINMNADATANAVKLNGDVFVTKEGIINLGLATKDSVLNGIIDNGGTANVTLKNGATWNNVANNTRYAQDNEDKGSNGRSHVTLLTGGASFDDAGTIVQKANSEMLWIDNLSGAVKVNYDCDVQDATLNNGVTIDSAAEGSQIALITKNTGIDTGNQETIDAVLNALANKLYYNAYVTGERNLSGIAVGIAEGMTASSVQVEKQAEIKFIETTGQGSLSGSASDGTGFNPDTGVEDQPGEGDVPEVKEPFTPIANIPDREHTYNANAEWKTGNTGAINISGILPSVHNDDIVNALYGELVVEGNSVQGYPIEYYFYWCYEGDCWHYYELPSNVIVDVNSDTGNVTKDIATAIYVTDDRERNAQFYTNGNTVVQVQSDTVKPVGIYATNGGAFYLSADGIVNILTKTNADEIKTNAIWVDPSLGGENLKIKATTYDSTGGSVCAPINISVLGGYGGNGIAITKSDGSKNCEDESKIYIDGNVVIKGQYDDEWGIVADRGNYNHRTNNAGILANVNNSEVEVRGTIDMAVYGNGITVDATNANVKIGTNTWNTNGGKIIVPQGNKDAQYYSLAAYEGSITLDTIIMGNTSYFKNGQITGDWYVGNEDGKNASINAYLQGEKAFFKGAIVNEKMGKDQMDGNHVANLSLENGATWYHASTNGEAGVVSKVNNFSARTGGAVVKIAQTADSGDIFINNYSGNAKVHYTYDESPVMLDGGSIVIENASSGSKLTLYTDYSDKITKDNLQNVMNSLANKVYYLGYQYKTDEKGNIVDANFGDNGKYADGDGNVYKDVDGEQVYLGNINAKEGEEGYLEEGFNPLRKDVDLGLSASVQIAEGLTTSSITADLVGAGIIDEEGKIVDSLADIEGTTNKITYNNGTLNAGVNFNDTTGQGSLTGEYGDGTGAYEDGGSAAEAFKDASGAYVKPIYGNTTKDSDYVLAKIYVKGEYNFTDAVNVFNTNNKKIDGGAWHSAVGVAISAHSKGNVTNVNLNDNDLIITNYATGSGAGIAAIDGGVVNINNPGDINISQLGHGLNGGIFANSGGEVYINNAETGGVVTIRTQASGADGAGIKTMNGVADVRSKVVITGMVDIVADLNTGNNEALSAVASTIEIGGGNIQAINGAWAAIRAYGEFVSDNMSIVDVNVVKDEDGNIIGAGDNKTTIYGDFVTNGGMGTKGTVSIGLNGKDSYWEGNYADTRGYGVTKGMEGGVNVYMKDGAQWTGFTDGEVDVVMEGKDTTWYGFNLCDYVADDVGKLNGGLTLTLNDGALWKNAINNEQVGSKKDSLVKEFNGNGGFIDMTGRETFIGYNDASHADGSNGVAEKRQTSIEVKNNAITGNLVITNYSGDTTVIYRHDDKDVTNILGGTTTIKTASAGSNITLSTDSTGVDMTNTTVVTNVLDNLAEKLFYTAYTTGERNLSGKVQIAEGLTTSSAGKYFGDIEFSTVDGQGGMKDGSLTKPGNTPTNPPAGDDDQDDNQQGGNEGGNQGGTTPEQPEQKPVVEETFAGGVTADSLTDTSEDSTNPYKDLIATDNAGNSVIDFSKLDKDEAGNDKPASEIVDIVKIEAAETAENNIVISSTSATQPVIIDMAGKDLAVSGTTTGENTEAKGISASNGAAVTISNAGNITIKANAENGIASAIYAQGTDAENKATVNIDNAESGGTVMLRTASTSNSAVLDASSHADVNITGKVDITNTNGNVAVSVGEGSTVAIGGGIIGDKAEDGKDSVAIHVNGGQVNINADGNETVVINGKIVLGQAPAKAKLKSVLKAGKPKVVSTETSSLALTDKDSSLNDDIHFAGGTGSNDFAIAITDGATWTGNSTGGVDLDVVLADGGAWTGYHEDAENNNTFKMQLSNGAEWTNTSEKATIMDSLSGEGGSIRMSDSAEADLQVSVYSGDTTFIYNNSYGKDVASENLIKGGDVTIVAVAPEATNANVTLRTHSIGTSDKDEVTRVLDALAQKLTYSAYKDAPSGLTGVVQIEEGMTTSSAMRTGKIQFAEGTGAGSLDTSSDITTDYTGDYIYGDDETAMMRGAKSAMVSTVMMWRSESADLLQRMGDLRMQEAEHGIWAKYYGGKYEMDAQNTNFTTSYTAYQLGYDKEVGNGWVVGAAVSHNDGDATYTMGGKGEATVTSLSVYGTKNYEDGRYLGLILKGGQLKNDFEVYNNDGYKLEGDYETFGTSLSAEYGKRIEKANGFYFDPSVELTIGRVQGKGYTATSDLLAAYGKTATMDVDQDSFNSMVGRIGFGIGQKLDKASYYAKLALAHEFAGDFDTTYTAEQTKGTSIDFGDTWYELQIGGTAKLNDNSLIYATYERSFGGDVTQKWRLDAGVRVTF